MRRAVGLGTLVVGIALAATAVPRPVGASGEAPHRDERSLERFAWECRSEIGRREVTLFANGTVRLRSGPWGAMGLELAELDRDALDATLRRLDHVRRSPSFPDPEAIQPWSGDLVGPRSERCRIHLDLPGQPVIDLEFTVFDATPHAFAQLKVIADDLALATRDLDSPEHLPADYEPEPDDVLRTADGLLYRVLRLTSDGRGVELERLDQPFQVIHAVEALGDVFVALEGQGIDPLVAEPGVDDLVVGEPSAPGGGGAWR